MTVHPALSLKHNSGPVRDHYVHEEDRGKDSGVRRSGCVFLHIRCGCFEHVDLCNNGVCVSVCVCFREEKMKPFSDRGVT